MYHFLVWFLATIKCKVLRIILSLFRYDQDMYYYLGINSAVSLTILLGGLILETWHYFRGAGPSNSSGEVATKLTALKREIEDLDVVERNLDQQKKHLQQNLRNVSEDPLNYQYPFHLQFYTHWTSFTSLTGVLLLRMKRIVSSYHCSFLYSY